MTNLGYLYRLIGQYELAEKTYLWAIKKNKENLTAWRNLSYLYRYMGHDEKANNIVSRVIRQRSENSFFHINRGDKAFDNEQWQIALRHYQRALKLDKRNHEVFFGLGKTYFELVDVKRSYHYLKLAKKKSRTEQQHAAYQRKINMLATIKPG